MERYIYSSGEFINVGNANRQEWRQKQLIFRFKETDREEEWITLYDASRNIWVALPVGGGKSYYKWGNSDWTKLYDVRRELIKETPSRQRIINFAEQQIRYGDSYKPSASDIENYFIESKSLTRKYATVDEKRAIANAVEGRTKSIMMQGRHGKIPIEWCGIFATYVLRLAGLNVCWQQGHLQNIKGFNEIKKNPVNSGIQKGDVGFNEFNDKGKRVWHHYIVIPLVIG